VYPSENNECIKIQISDFGLANVDECFDKPFEWELFIPPYRPPELGLYREHLEEGYDTRPTFPLYTRKTDSWVLGCMLYAILTGKDIFQPKSDTDTSFYREIVGMKVDDIENEDELSQLLKLWVEYDNIDREEDSKRDGEILKKIQKNVPEKYVTIIYSLLKFYPQERMDIRDVANYEGLFDDVKDLCISKPTKSIDVMRGDDTVAYCLEYLNKVQFPVGDKRIETTTKKHRVMIIDACEQLVSTFGFEVDLGGRVKALTVALLDTFAERNIREMGKEWKQETYYPYLAGAFLVSVAFYGEVITIETLDIVGAIGTSDVYSVFSCALQVFASIDFKLVKSTSYDLVRINKSEYSQDVVNTAYWLLQISYMTNIYNEYSHERICFGLYLLSQILNDKKVNNLPTDREVAVKLLKEIRQIRKYIDDELLAATMREGVYPKEMFEKLLLLKL